ncbi:DNA cytosine methyltransferase [Allopusillimonas ginsengisoli]|uniref:DNA cytosine methyltransferase n=1 Tax=Allopusillimonas ginsengisoli TaxID=453575 RepID=UPI00101EB8BF|nr:DNA cytosine methyltransferase [Allopusillimonas ginsengisoli]TEA70168.1 DNA cytosine methyltransferase [Allopusillimonas ginsengisoli]
MSKFDSIPVIDLFAGPGGLGEGFSSIRGDDGGSRFEIRVSIEKEAVAHRTLSLRALYRALRNKHVPDCYYDYVSGKISREQFFSHPDVSDEARNAALEARCLELGGTPDAEIDGLIEQALGRSSEWVLIGGPPCQAYSMAGRSRMRPGDPKKFERDKRHLLYEQYLRILREFGPSIFVMENVKGILTSRLGGSLIFDRILSDLSNPGNGHHYQIRSFVTDGSDLNPSDFLIQSEDYGLPQARHRVIILGIRSDIAEACSSQQESGRFLLKASSLKMRVEDALVGMPPLRSKLSREEDSHEKWLSALKESKQGLKMWRDPDRQRIEERMTDAYVDAASHASAGGLFVAGQPDFSKMPESLRSWLVDPRLPGVLQHEARKHMRSDLGRYLFASCYATVTGRSPKLSDFPPRLLPMHSNIFDETIPFLDRFRVQRNGEPSTTIVSHIAKDGHYYIHPDPSQCRSLTVREAARLQTFPDNYYFEGNRTEQYWQVGNAVPPLLARQIAEIVLDLLDSVRSQTYERAAYG